MKKKFVMMDQNTQYKREGNSERRRKLNKNRHIIVTSKPNIREKVTPRGDGNFNTFNSSLVTHSIREKVTPRGDGNFSIL